MHSWRRLELLGSLGVGGRFALFELLASVFFFSGRGARDHVESLRYPPASDEETILARGPRLDEPGALHHVMARGLERREIFVADSDRDDFLTRVEAVTRRGWAVVYAWALMPNHVHLLIRTVSAPLGRVMRSVLAGYACAFNQRYDRVGHLFQNRYKSIFCEEDNYFLQLVRYIHLNPVVAGILPDVNRLATYPYTGHAALVGYATFRWQDTMTVLSSFGGTIDEARKAYVDFVIAGTSEEEAGQLEGCGIRRFGAQHHSVKRLD